MPAVANTVAPSAYREALRSGQPLRTAITSSISERPARRVVSRLHELGRVGRLIIPDCPSARDAGKALHQAAASHGDSGCAAPWAGQAAVLPRDLLPTTLTKTFVDEWLDVSAAAIDDGP